ncbi:MAG: hypothetical protein ACFB12_17605 [Leptolyngbyaceae cyanobacterium]
MVLLTRVYGGINRLQQVTSSLTSRATSQSARGEQPNARSRCGGMIAC